MKNNMLPPCIIQWVKENIGSNDIITNTYKLKGSTSSTLHRMKMGQMCDLVIRQFDNKEWNDEEPDLAKHEAASLAKATGAKVPTPKLIAFDETGKECGVPAVLMSFLEGDVELLPNNKSTWLHSLAEALIQVHQVNAADFPYIYCHYQKKALLKEPDWSSVPEKWKKAITYIQTPAPAYTPHFIHRDYHPANVLWKEEKVVGVVDWVNACVGPAGIDIGHCRVNLAMLHDVRTADAFLEGYRTLNNHFTYDPYWDIVSLLDMSVGEPEVYPGWRAFGVTGLTNRMMAERLDKYVASLVERIL